MKYFLWLLLITAAGCNSRKEKGGDADDGVTPVVSASEISFSVVSRNVFARSCTSCHGANFSTPIDPSYPKLAGQHPDYLYEALKEYQTDKNPQVGRNNAIMMGMARPFTHAEAKILAAYIASLPSELRTVPQSRFRFSSN